MTEPFHDGVKVGCHHEPAKAHWARTRIGRPNPAAPEVEARIHEALRGGTGICKVAPEIGDGASVVQRIAVDVRDGYATGKRQRLGAGLGPATPEAYRDGSVR